MKEIKVGKILKIEGIELLIQITENITDKILITKDISDFIISINRLVFTKAPSGKYLLAKIQKIYDRSLYFNEDIYHKGENSYFIEAKLVGIYDPYLDKIDFGVNTFPIIASEVYAVNDQMYKRVLSIDSEYKLEIGRSFYNNDLKVFANPDILFGKHLSIIGNSGTGKSCTVASIIQGLKQRMKLNGEICPKIIILDTNKEYEDAFKDTGFKVKVIKKDEIKMPHFMLEITEYYKLLGAGQGIQAPILKQAINKLKSKNKNFDFCDLPKAINNIIIAKSGGFDPDDPIQGNSYTYAKLTDWLSTLIIRIEEFIEDERFNNIIKASESDIVDFLDKSEDEIILFQLDLEKDVLDVVMFLLCKNIYSWCQTKKKKQNVLLVLEEAHRYIHEKDSEEYKLGNHYIERLAKEGRKFGISLIVSSQRPSEISKSVLSQCNSFIIHKITNKNDLEFISKLLPIDDYEILKIIPGLEKQYAIVTGEAFGYSEIVKIADADPKPNSRDPEVIKSWEIDLKALEKEKSKANTIMKNKIT